MKREFVIDDHTRMSQGKASTPHNSAWVSANAGSGKTYVLAQRVVRLLLSGVEPSRILCLTYTKAAAGEMSNRVFEILGNWVALDEAELRQELQGIEGQSPDAAQMDRARILFARALETPGGLKIQTIHAFCEALLHQFPLEANVPGTFAVMDDLMQRRILAQIREDLSLAAYQGPSTELGKSFSHLMDLASDSQLEKVFGELVEQRENLATYLTQTGGPKDATAHTRQQLGFNPDDQVDALTANAIGDSLFQRLNCQQVADVAMANGAVQAVEFGQNLNRFLTAETTYDKAQAIDGLLLTKAGSPRKFNRYPAKDIAEAFPELRDQLSDESQRWLAAKARIKTLRLIDNTEPLLVIADAMIARYDRAKRDRGVLDFDDLIERTADLLSRSDARSWVLYKLDLGIDHILLDEAQDTSPQQWLIISALVEEFFAGQSARLTNRTVFAVGDEKQSIYSFRGAEPRNFSQQKRQYLKRAGAADKPLVEVGLDLSFRSTGDVLGAVDAVFAIDDHAQGVTFDAPPPAHTAARRNDPGSVDVWDLITASEGDAPENWHTPVDFSGQHQALILAENIASQLHMWIGRETVEASGKIISAGDILVLVRSRDRFVGALNRALKARGIPVSGADRLVITDHIAIQDLIALGQVTLTPQDDLTLATLLKCPLIGFSEDDLFELAQSRSMNESQGEKKGEISLFEALRSQRKPNYVAAFEQINNWRRFSDQLPVFEFYAQILGPDGGRKKFLSRLGSEAEDVLDAFLDAALSHESDAVPGLQSFLEALLEEQPEIKREMDRTAGEVRIMTVHAAKGLESPIVFLVDKCSPAFQPQHASALYHWTDQHQPPCYLWVPAASDHCPKTLELRDAQKRRAEEEYRRLLYVGMTRAEDRLVICGYRGTREPTAPNWHAMVSRALEPGWTAVEDAQGNLLWHRWRMPDSAPPRQLAPQEQLPITDQIKGEMPDWIDHQLPPEKALPRPLNPSGTQAVIDETLIRQTAVHSPFAVTTSAPDQPDPRLRGTVVHHLLQLLPDMPAVERRSVAQTYLAKKLAHHSQSNREALLNSIEQVLLHPLLEPCFDPLVSRGEVALMGTIDTKNGPRSVSGQIDRIAVLDDRVFVLDYKTNIQVPSDPGQVPRDYITQMAMYRALAARIYPTRLVSCLLVWTHGAEGPVVMDLESAQMDAALTQIAEL